MERRLHRMRLHAQARRVAVAVPQAHGAREEVLIMNESSVQIERIAKEALKLIDQIAKSVDGYIDGAKTAKARSGGVVL